MDSKRMANSKITVDSKITMPGCALIAELYFAVGLADYGRKSSMNRTSILTSGGFDPIHPGHISYLLDSIEKVKALHRKSHGRVPRIQLFVVVNSDGFLERKKGRAFMPLRARCQVVSAVLPYKDHQCVVIPFIPSLPEDMSVCEAIGALQPTYFCKGGDRDASNIPETKICGEVGTQIISGCGDDKYWSSSDFIDKHNAWLYDETKRLGGNFGNIWHRDNDSKS